MKLDLMILSTLINDEEYFRKVIPFLNEEYFTDGKERRIFSAIKTFADKYNSPPTIEALGVEIQSARDLNDSEYAGVVSILEEIGVPPDTNMQWLLDNTEKFCKDKAVYNAIVKSIQIIDGKDKEHSQEGIPDILQKALSVCFDTNVGHDYFQDSESRFDFYHRRENKIPFDLEMFNKITKGGIPNKTLNICLAGCVHPETKVLIRFRKRSSS